MIGQHLRFRNEQAGADKEIDGPDTADEAFRALGLCSRIKPFVNLLRASFSAMMICVGHLLEQVCLPT